MRSWKHHRLLSILALTMGVGFLGVERAHAACALPYTLTNGQVADATQVMANYNALLNCVNGAVSPGTAGQIGYYANDGVSLSGAGLTSLIDASMGSTQGSILYRDATGWKMLPPGTTQQFLQTQGIGANPKWAVPSASGGSGLLASLTTDQGNGNGTTEDTLYTYTMPGQTLSADGDTIEINAYVNFANNTHSKAARLYFGSTYVEGFYNYTGASAATIVMFKIQIVRRANNAQLSFGNNLTFTGAVGTSSLSAANSFANGVLLSQDLSNPIDIKVTGQTNIAAANDVVLRVFNVRKL